MVAVVVALVVVAVLAAVVVVLMAATAVTERNLDALTAMVLLRRRGSSGHPVLRVLLVL